MLQYPLRIGPTEELVWYVAEANALRRVRSEVSSAVRAPPDRRDAALGDARPPRRAPVRARVSEDAGHRSPTAWPSCLSRFGAVDDRNLDRRRLGRVHPPGPLAALLRRRPRPARLTRRRPPPPVRQRDLLLEATRRRHRRAGARRADPVLRGVPRPGYGPLAAAPARGGLLPRLLLAVPPAGRAAGRLDARSRPRARPARGPGGRAARFDPGIARCARGRPRRSGRPSSRRRCWPCAAGEAWSARSSSAATASVSPDRRGKPGRVSGDPAVARPVRPGIHTARTVLGIEAPVRGFWSLARGKDDPHWPPSVEQRAFLVFQLAQVLRPLARRPLPPEQAGVGDARCKRSSRSRRSSGGGSSTWRTSDDSVYQTLDAIALHARRPSRPARIAAVPGGLLPRRARGVVPPPPRGAGP